MPSHSAATPINIPELSAARGKIGKVEAWNKFGYNTNVGTAYEVIWENGGSYAGWLQTADNIRIRAGGNTADDATGNNARKIVVEGLAADFTVQTVEITTAGASASASTTETFIRVFRAYVTDVGVYGNTNAGNIIIETDGGTIVAIIGAGFGQTEMALYTVPAGKTLYLMRLNAFQDSNKDVLVQLKQRQNADDTSAPVTGVRTMRVISMPAGGQGHMETNGSVIFPAKTDIWLEAKASASGDGVTAMMNGYLVDD